MYLGDLIRDLENIEVNPKGTVLEDVDRSYKKVKAILSTRPWRPVGL
jgi:hypothetical protein